jgi:hypothetical protein
MSPDNPHNRDLSARLADLFASGRTNWRTRSKADGIFAGDRPIIVGVLTAIGVEQGVLYWRYRHQVGEDNTSLDRGPGRGRQAGR